MSYICPVLKTYHKAWLDVRKEEINTTNPTNESKSMTGLSDYKNHRINSPESGDHKVDENVYYRANDTVAYKDSE